MRTIRINPAAAVAVEITQFRGRLLSGKAEWQPKLTVQKPVVLFDRREMSPDSIPIRCCSGFPWRPPGFLAVALISAFGLGGILNKADHQVLLAYGGGIRFMNWLAQHSVVVWMRNNPGFPEELG